VVAALKQCTGSVGASNNGSTPSLWEISCAISGGELHIVWASYGAYNFTSAESSISSASATDVLGNSIPVTVSGLNASFNVVDTVGPTIEITMH
jgi:hypothetical protein